MRPEVGDFRCGVIKSNNVKEPIPRNSRPVRSTEQSRECESTCASLSPQHFTWSRSSCSVWTPLEESALPPRVWTSSAILYRHLDMEPDFRPISFTGLSYFSPTHPSCHQFLLTSCICIAFLSVEWMSFISLLSLNASTYSSRQHKGQCLRQPSLGFLGCTSTTSNHVCLIIYCSPSIGFVSVPRCQFLCSVSHFLTQWLSILSGI